MVFRLRLLAGLVASLLLSEYGLAQTKVSPLARYPYADSQGLDELGRDGALRATDQSTDSIRQRYRSLAEVSRAPSATGVNARTVVAIASQISAIKDDRFTLSPRGSYAIGDRAWAVQFDLEFKGIPVAHPTSKMILIDESGQPLELRDRQIPESLPDSIEPTNSPEPAVQRAIAAATRRWSLLYPKLLPSRFVTTIPSTEIWVDENQRGHLAWVVFVRAEDVRVPISLQCWVAATGDARLLFVKDLVYSARRGKVVGSVWMTTPAAGPGHATPLAGIFTTLSDSGESTVTDANGNFHFNNNLPINECIRAGLLGPRCIVMNDAGAELRGECYCPSSKDGIIDFHATTDSEIAQLSAFYWINRAADFTHSTKIGERLNLIPTRVNQNETGNAFWDGYALLFDKAGDGFPNTAYSDVIIHEYGHALDGRLGGILSRSYSEGFGDALVILITQQSQVGRDFYGPGQPLRDAREIVKWAGENGDPHRVGQVYSGFVWELIQQLKASGDRAPFETAKKLVIGAAEMNPKDIVDAVRLSYVADAPGGILAKGTPHSMELSAAANSRAIPHP